MARKNSRPQKRTLEEQTKQTWDLNQICCEISETINEEKPVKNKQSVKVKGGKFSNSADVFVLNNDQIGDQNRFIVIKTVVLHNLRFNTAKCFLNTLSSGPKSYISVFCQYPVFSKCHENGSCGLCYEISTNANTDINWLLVSKCVNNGSLQLILSDSSLVIGLNLAFFEPFKEKFAPNNILSPLKQCLLNLGCLSNYEISSENVSQTENLRKTFVQLLIDNMMYKMSVSNDPHVIQHPKLQSTLRHYQIATIQWMLNQEKNKDILNRKFAWKIPCLEIKNCGEVVAYIYPESGYVSKRPILCDMNLKLQHSGGILADEMGLGKTVEAITCVLLNPKTDANLWDDSCSAELANFNENYINKVYECLPDSKQIDGNSNENICVTLAKLRRHSESKKDFVKIADLILNVFLQYGETTMKVVLHSAGFITEKWQIKLSIKTVEKEFHKLVSKKILTSTQKVLKKGNTRSYRLAKKPSNDVMKRLESIKVLFESYEASLSVKKDNKLFHNLNCICGNDEHDRLDNPVIECSMCKTLQHKNCVKFSFYLDKYLCPHCCVLDENLITSKTTLVVAPQIIYKQWLDEINYHVKPDQLSVLCYNGLKSIGYIQPYTLAKYDIIVTTYDTMRTEIHNTNLPHHSNNRLRRKKVYMAIPSPLMGLKWWRVCLDEAQMIGNAAENASRMAGLLPAVHRWCITGTPVSNGINDLYGQLNFLGLEPLTNKSAWTRFVEKQFNSGHCESLLDTMRCVMWRNTKENVVSELDLPPIKSTEHSLVNSHVEKYFYKKVHETCKSEFLTMISSTKNEAVLDMDVLKKISLSLKKLRQACCDPSITSYFNKHPRYALPQTETATMEVLLDRLLKKCVLECEESHRHLNAAKNGLAGIFILEEKHSEAVMLYREILKDSDQLKEVIRTDSLQSLHVVYNLHKVLVENPGKYGVTARDDQLAQMCVDVETSYLQKYEDDVVNKHKQVTNTIESCNLCIEDPYFEEGWWEKVVQFSESSNLSDELLLTVNKASDTIKTSRLFSKSYNFPSLSSLLYFLTKELTSFNQTQTKLRTTMKDIFTKHKNPDFQLKACNCHLRPTKDKEDIEKCELCLVEKSFSDVEAKLFSPVVEKEGTDNTHTGIKAKGYLEVLLQAIFSFGKRHKNFVALNDISSIGASHMNLIEKLKKLYDYMHTFLGDIGCYVAAVDELKMAKATLQVNYEEKSEKDALNVVHFTELTSTRLTLQSDINYYKEMLHLKLGQLRYLKNLLKFENCSDSGEKPLNSDPLSCPICTGQLGMYWVMYQCGHCYCMRCQELVVKNAGGKFFKCAICRTETLHEDVSYVSAEKEIITDNETVVLGNHSTKVKGIVREILKIENNEKIIVFSMWVQMLNVIAQALVQNNLSHKLVISPSSKTFADDMKTFKTHDDCRVLLMPLSIGGKGLNVTEANHVFFAEPILSKAVQLQAAGRVHRIGQTKQTTIHKFIIKQTIEERLSNLLDQRNTLPDDKINISSTKNLSDEKMLQDISIGNLHQLFN